MAITYISGAELPDVEVTWRDSDDSIIDYSTGWTFTVKIGALGQSAVLTKTDGVTGSATAPNVSISWSSTELDAVPVGDYTLEIVARNTASGKDRVMQDTITIAARVI